MTLEITDNPMTKNGDFGLYQKILATSLEERKARWKESRRKLLSLDRRGKLDTYSYYMTMNTKGVAHHLVRRLDLLTQGFTPTGVFIWPEKSRLNLFGGIDLLLERIERIILTFREDILGRVILDLLSETIRTAPEAFLGLRPELGSSGKDLDWVPVDPSSKSWGMTAVAPSCGYGSPIRFPLHSHQEVAVVLKKGGEAEVVGTPVMMGEKGGRPAFFPNFGGIPIGFRRPRDKFVPGEVQTPKERKVVEDAAVEAFWGGEKK
jgi:hypothetical protein